MRPVGRARIWKEGCAPPSRWSRPPVRAGGGGRGPSTLLVTDGRATVGADPAPLADRFAHLVVLRVGEGDSGEETCRELARRGNGTVRHVARLENLPLVLYQAVQEMLRGRG